MELSAVALAVGEQPSPSRKPSIIIILCRRLTALYSTDMVMISQSLLPLLA
jgi:hypothetical protein